MKKVFVLVLSLILLVSLFPVAAFAAFADFASLSDDELMAELNQIRAELVKRAEIKEGKQVLAEVDGLTVMLKGEPEWNKSYNGTHCITLTVTVVNSSEKAMAIRTDDCYVNGWKVRTSFNSQLEAGTKTKDIIYIYSVDEDADLESLEDLEDIKFIFLTFDPSTFSTQTRDITATITY